MEVEGSGRAPQAQAEHWGESSYVSEEKQREKAREASGPSPSCPLGPGGQGDVFSSSTRKGPEALNRLDLVL